MTQLLDREHEFFRYGFAATRLAADCLATFADFLDVLLAIAFDVVDPQRGDDGQVLQQQHGQRQQRPRVPHVEPPRLEMVEHLVLQHNDPKATNTAKHPTNVAPHDGGDAAVLNGRLTAILPRLSWNVIRMSKASTE